MVTSHQHAPTSYLAELLSNPPSPPCVIVRDHSFPHAKFCICPCQIAYLHPSKWQQFSQINFISESGRQQKIRNTSKFSKRRRILVWDNCQYSSDRSLSQKKMCFLCNFSCLKSQRYWMLNLLVMLVPGALFCLKQSKISALNTEFK